MCDIFIPHAVTFPLTTTEGYNYIIDLQKIDIKELAPDIIDEVKVDIYDVNLKLYGAKVADINFNNPATLYRIGSVLLDFIIENDAILYYFCDTKPIKKSEKRKHLSHQEFRHLLFETMYDYVKIRRKVESLTDNSIVINGGEQEKYYLHLLSFTKHQPTVDLLSNELQELNK